MIHFQRWVCSASGRSSLNLIFIKHNLRSKHKSVHTASFSLDNNYRLNLKINLNPKIWRCLNILNQPKRCGAILPSCWMFWLWTVLPSMMTGFLSSSTGSWVKWILWLTTNNGLFVLSTSSFSDIPSRYCFSKDLSIWLSLLKAYFCFWMANLSNKTLLCLLKKLFRYLNSSYSSGVSYWNWFFSSSES